MISIALATYNGAQYLEEQLESYLHQTRQPDELVVCDDGSSDDTLAVLEKFQAKAPFTVKIQQNTTNRGTVTSFAKAVSGCSGDVIFFSDHDDVWLPEKIEVMVSTLEADKEIGLVFCDAEVVDDNLQPLNCSFWESVWFDQKSRELVNKGQAFPIFLNHIVVAGMSAAFSADYKSLILPIPDLSDGYDGWTALLIAAVAKIALVDRCLVKYRVHGGNQVGVKRLGFLEQMRIGIRQVQNNTFPNLLHYRKEVLKRLEEYKAGKPQAIEEALLHSIRESIRHLENRINLPENKLMRIFPVLAETVRGNYARYSYGFKSIAQDLFLK